MRNSSKESIIFSVLDTFDWPDETLMELIDNLPKKIRLYIAENLTVSEVVLRKLADDLWEEIRMVIAQKTSISHDMRTKLERIHVIEFD